MAANAQTNNQERTPFKRDIDLSKGTKLGTVTKKTIELKSKKDEDGNPAVMTAIELKFLSDVKLVVDGKEVPLSELVGGKRKYRNIVLESVKEKYAFKVEKEWMTQEECDKKLAEFREKDIVYEVTLKPLA